MGRSSESLCVADAFRDAGEAFGIASGLVVAPTIGSAYALFSADTASMASGIRRRLRRAGFDWRRWYGLGVHTHPHFTQYSSDQAPVTEHLGATVVGLPTAADLDPIEARRIVAAVCRPRAADSSIARSTKVSAVNPLARAD
jgi:dTDP-4-amino-4,6-dideoxygalactose transaminase